MVATEQDIFLQFGVLHLLEIQEYILTNGLDRVQLVVSTWQLSKEHLSEGTSSKHQFKDEILQLHISIVLVANHHRLADSTHLLLVCLRHLRPKERIHFILVLFALPCLPFDVQIVRLQIEWIIIAFLGDLLQVLIFTFHLLVEESCVLVWEVIHTLLFTLSVVCLMISNQFICWYRVDAKSFVPVKGEESKCEEVKELFSII